MHVGYKNGRFYRFPDQTITSYESGESATVNAEGGGAATLEAGLRIDFKFFNVWGPYVTFGPYITGSIGTVYDFKELKYHVQLVGGLKGSLGLSWPEWRISTAGEEVIYDNLFNAPAFGVFPEYQNVTVGDSVKFFPQVSGSRPMEFTWIKDGVDIGWREKNLEFSATKESGGVYTCVASNQYGEDRCEVTLNVLDAVSPSNFAGTWRQRASANEEREFVISESGDGYWQLLNNGVPVYAPGEWPITSRMCDDGRLEIVRQSPASRPDYDGGSTVFYITRLTPDRGFLLKATGESVGLTTEIRRVSDDGELPLPMEAFCGDWWQKAEKYEDENGLVGIAYRVFYIRADGTGYFQLFKNSVPQWTPSDYPITCRVENDNRLRILRGDGTEFHIRLKRDGVGTLTKTGGSVGLSSTIRRK